MRSFSREKSSLFDPVAEVGLGVQHLARLGNDVAGDFQRNRDHAIGIGVNQITGLHPYPAHFDWHLGFEKAEVAMGRYHARCEVVETHLANGVQVAYPAVRDETDRSQSLRHRRQAVAEMAAVVWPGSNVLQHQHHGLRKSLIASKHRRRASLSWTRAWVVVSRVAVTAYPTMTPSSGNMQRMSQP